MVRPETLDAPARIPEDSAVTALTADAYATDNAYEHDDAATEFAAASAPAHTIDIVVRPAATSFIDTARLVADGKLPALFLNPGDGANLADIANLAEETNLVDGANFADATNSVDGADSGNGTVAGGKAGSGGQNPNGDGKHRDTELQAAQVEAEEAATEYGTEVRVERNDDGELEYTFYVEQNGQETVLLQTTNPQYEQELADLQEQMIRDLEEQWHVDVSEGETREVHGQSEGDDPNDMYEEYPDEDGDGLVEVETIKPDLGQLVALDAALYLSQPSNLGPDGEGISIIFTADDVSDSIAYFQRSGDSPAIVYEADEGEDRHIESVDGMTQGLVHELSHSSQNNVLGNDRDEYYESLGWKKIELEEGGEQWLLEGQDGYFYRPQHNDGEDQQWVRYNEDGQAVDENGDVIEVNDEGYPADPEEAYTLTIDEMRQNAVIEPISFYFTNGTEMGAEGIKHFRLSEADRANLLIESPELYEISKQHDQAEMDMMFGTNEDGSSKYIRMPDGNIYPNTPENRAIVKEWEEDVRAIGEQREDVAEYIEENRDTLTEAGIIDDDGNIDYEKLVEFVFEAAQFPGGYIPELGYLIRNYDILVGYDGQLELSDLAA